ncbi:DUF4340 domain-containing protein [Gemmatimonadota bacterium]
MNWKVILLLLVATLGLGAYLVFQEKPESEQTEDQQKIERILPYSPDEVRRITVIYRDTTYVIVRDGNEWTMEQPAVSGEADSLVVNHLVRTLCETAFINSIPVDELDLEDVELIHPVLVFTAYNQAGDSTRLEFGTLNPTTDNIYIHRRGEGRVVLVNKLLGPMLTVNNFLLMGKSLTGVSPYHAVGVEVESGGRNVFRAFRSTERGRWWIGDGRDTLWADQYKLKIRLAELYDGQVREFYEEDSVPVTETGLNRPVRTLKVAATSGDTTVVAFGKPEIDREYLRWASSSIYPGQLLLIDSWLIERIDVFRADSMQCRELADFFPLDVDLISLSSPLDSLVLTAYNDTLWNIVTPQQAKAKYLMVEQLLVHADTVEAKKIIPPGSNRGYETPQARLVLKRGDELLADIVFGDYAGEDIYVRDNKRNMDFLASSVEVAPLNITFKELADIPVRHVVE